MTGNALIERIGIHLPIVQAPMAGVSSPAMAAAVSEAGALGSIVGRCDGCERRTRDDCRGAHKIARPVQRQSVLPPSRGCRPGHRGSVDRALSSGVRGVRCRSTPRACRNLPQLRRGRRHARSAARHASGGGEFPLRPAGRSKQCAPSATQGSYCSPRQPTLPKHKRSPPPASMPSSHRDGKRAGIAACSIPTPMTSGWT